MFQERATLMDLLPALPLCWADLSIQGKQIEQPYGAVLPS